MPASDPTTKPTIGAKAVCASCGEEIEYVGPYWRHTKSSPRHPAAPRASDPTTPLTDKWRRMHEDARQGFYGELSPRLVELLDELEAVKRERDVYRAFVKADGASWMEAQKLIASSPPAQGGADDLTDEDREDVRDALATLNAPDFSTKPLEDVKRELDLANGARGGCPHCGCPSPCACPKAWEDRQGADGAGEDEDDRHL